MGSPEAVCERVGSLMHAAHSAARNLDAGALMGLVLLREAGVTCIGSARDESICEEDDDSICQ